MVWGGLMCFGVFPRSGVKYARKIQYLVFWPKFNEMIKNTDINYN